jgi:DNA-directed RNA polymerase specialized sigma subunit
MINPEELPEMSAGGDKHPSSEQLMMRMAVEKALMNKQQRVWEWYNYDRLTHAEIAKKLKITSSAVTQQIKTIERQLKKWITQHSDIYETIKEACK